MWSSSSSPSEGSSNLQRFLRSVTPFVPSKPVPQHQGGIHEVNSQWHCGEYFSLGELWGCYDEWSAYGAGTQVVLNNGEDVVQYYVPYLSGIQIYTRNPIREDSGEEVEFWSDDSESDKLSRSLSNNSNKTWDVASGDTNIDHEMSRLGNLYFQYFDTCSPYWRIPLVERIIEFAENHSGLFTLKSVDLSPASWMAVAWYPIYHIPTKGSLKDLSACFLSYHTLSSSFQEIMKLSFSLLSKPPAKQQQNLKSSQSFNNDAERDLSAHREYVTKFDSAKSLTQSQPKKSLKIRTNGRPQRR